MYIKSSTFNTWFKLFSLHDFEKLREKIYFDILNFPFHGNGWPKPNIYKLSEIITNGFTNLLKIRGHNTYGIRVSYTDDTFNPIFKIKPQFSPNSDDKNILEKYYKFLIGDTLKVGISQYQWDKILKTNKNKKEIFNIISQFPEWDCSGWKGYISDEDLYILASKIIENFTILKINFENSCSGWKIATNTKGTWVEIQKEY